MGRTLGREGGPIRVVIADDSGLTFSDDYRKGWKSGFEKIGCQVDVVDIKPLRRLLMSAGSPYRASGMAGTGKAIAKQIISKNPDLVWCHHGRAASLPEFIDQLHRAGLRTAVYLCDEPYETGETARYSPRFRFVFSMDFETVNVHRMSRPDRSNVFYLPPSADTLLFCKRDYLKRGIKAFFLGNASLNPREAWLRPIERLVDGADIRYFGGSDKRKQTWVPFEKHPELYADCVVGLNVHRDPGITMECFKRRVVGRPSSWGVPKGLTLCGRPPSVDGTGFWNDGNLPASHVNPRFMEMAACGTLVVSDDSRSELRRLFPMAPRASNPERFYELVEYYIKNQDEAEAIGEKCSDLISKRHSYYHRAAEILIRVGLMESLPENLLSFLGEPRDWLTPQDTALLTGKSSSGQTGPSEPWSPQYGMLLTRTSGKVSDSSSLDLPTPW